MQYKCQYQVASFKQQTGSLLANIMDLNLQLQLINYLTFDTIQFVQNNIYQSQKL